MRGKKSNFLVIFVFLPFPIMFFYHPLCVLFSVSTVGIFCRVQIHTLLIGKYTSTKPRRHHREVSTELKPHCTGLLWVPAVRKRPFCSARSISKSQGNGGDQPLDF